MRPAGMILWGRQRGISLLWTAIAVAVLSLLAMMALMSMRQERNLFADAWHHIAGGSALSAAVAPGRGDAPAADPRPIRKCVVGGRTVYSNVECGAAGGREVDVRSSRGIEAPKAPPVEPAAADKADIVDGLVQKGAAR